MNEYWRNRLDQESNRCYSSILQAIRRQSRNVNCGNASVESVKNAYFAIYDDHPELFYLSNAPQISQTRSGFAGVGSFFCSTSVDMMPIYSASEIRNCEIKIDKAKAAIKSKITSSTSDEEKVIMAAEYLVRTTEYEINNYYNQNAASALCFGKAQCSGITKAFKLLMDCFGVYCISISGDADDERGNSGPHAWNIVKISNNYYHIDVTFMLGANSSKSLPLVKMYLFYDDEQIGKNHTWDRSQVPRCTDKSKYLNDFDKSGTFVRKITSFAERACKKYAAKRYTSLSELRTDMREIIKNRKNSIAFYLDIGKKDSSDIMRAAQNAFSMAVTKENIGCSFSVTVLQDSLVNIEIDY